MSVHEQKARAAWGADIPDWVLILAQEADRTSQNRVAKRLQRTASLVSVILSKTYGASYDGIEETVRGVLLRETVDCPGMRDDITKDVCASWRKKADRFSGHNPQRVAMFRACHRCPIYRESRHA